METEYYEVVGDNFNHMAGLTVFQLLLLFSNTTFIIIIYQHKTSNPLKNRNGSGYKNTRVRVQGTIDKAHPKPEPMSSADTNTPKLIPSIAIEKAQFFGRSP